MTTSSAWRSRRAKRACSASTARAASIRPWCRSSTAHFLPSAEELDRARRMIAEFERAKASGQGAFAFEGKMVDEPVVQRARALLERA